MRILFNLILVIGLLVSAGCQPTVEREENSKSEIESNPTTTLLPEVSTKTIVPPDRMETLMNKTPERVPHTQEPTPVTGEVPSELLNSILKDLLERTGAAPEEVSIIRGQAVVWSDGSLGCPQPGMMYNQALVNGYWVELEIAGKKFDYRAAKTGYFFLCESGFPPGILPVTPDS